jgi:hypothetical protein
MIELFSNFFDVSFELDLILKNDKFNSYITEKAIQSISLLQVFLEISKEKFPSRIANIVFIQKIAYYKKCFKIDYDFDINDLQLCMLKDSIVNLNVQCLVKDYYHENLKSDNNKEAGKSLLKRLSSKIKPKSPVPLFSK